MSKRGHQAILGRPRHVGMVGRARSEAAQRGKGLREGRPVQPGQPSRCLTDSLASEKQVPQH